MAIYVNSSGQPIINSSGAPIDCSTCPCGGEDGTIDGCHDDLMSDCYEVVLAGVTDNGGEGFACGPLICAAFNTTWTLNNTSPTGWAGSYVDVGCTGGECGDGLRATLGIVAGHPFNGIGAPGSICRDPDYCVWTFTIGADNSEDDCGVSVVYRACFPKTDDPMTPKVLDFVSGTTVCNDEPATVTVNTC